MIPEQEKSRSRMQMSLALHSINMQVDEILGSKTQDEKQVLSEIVFKMVPEGCLAYARKMKDVQGDIDDSDSARFVSSPHGVSVVDALLIALEESGQFSLLQQAEIFASLAQILHDEIPYEIRWAISKGEEFAINDPLALLSIGVHATDAMYAVSEARQRRIAAAISSVDITQKVAEVISDNARKNGSLAHVKNRELKATVFEWCEKNLSQYKSMDQAAEAIAGVKIPRAFTTVRSWIREWKKHNAQGGKRLSSRIS